MKENIRKSLSELTNLIGVAGDEREVIKYLREMFIPVADGVDVSTIGNLIAVKKGSRPGPKLLLAAHSDEVGYAVKSILNNGFLIFEKIGIPPDKVMPGRKVWINTNKGRVPGIIGIKPAHMQSPEELKKVHTTDELYIDVASASKEETTDMGIRTGDRVAIQSEFMEMANRDYVCARAIDNRVSCSVLLQLFEELGKTDFAGTVYAAMTVHEESGFTGSKVIGGIIEPDYAIVLDTIPAADTPDSDPQRQSTWLGKGPACPLDYGIANGVYFHYIHPKVKEIIEKASENTGIPIQYTTILEAGYLTEAPFISAGYKGIPTGTLSVPRRYSHSPVELMNLNDAAGLVKILLEIIGSNSSLSFDFI